MWSFMQAVIPTEVFYLFLVFTMSCLLLNHSDRILKKENLCVPVVYAVVILIEAQEQFVAYLNEFLLNPFRIF